MKKTITITLILLLCLGFLTGCGTESQTENKKESSGAVTTTITAKPTYSVKSFKVEATVPGEEKENDEGEKEIEPKYKIATSGLKYSNADVGIIGDKVEFDFDYGTYVYNSFAQYKEKYGTKEVNYDNYLEFLKDESLDSVKATQKDFEEVKFAGYDAIRYNYSGRMIYVIKCDELDSSRCFQCWVCAVNKDDKVEDLINEDSIKEVMESFVISSYNK